MLTQVPKRLLTRARRFREDLHRHPELGYEETRTAGRVAKALRAAGLDEVHTGVAGTGIVALLRGAGPGPTVALRADMDALPIREETGLPYASVRDGLMHACGHDGHTAILVATAELLGRMRERLAGNVKFIFQPAEEGGGGGERMVAEGCLRNPPVECIFALHARPDLSPGQIGLSRTPNVAVNGFRLTVSGRGGHGSRPHECVDPVAIGAQIVTAAQTIVSRECRPDRPVVLTFGSFQAGTRSNVIPDRALLLGTIRAMDLASARRVRRAVARLAAGIAKGMRGRVMVEDDQLYPPVNNDPGLMEMVAATARDLFGRSAVVPPTEQRMGGEDFAFYLPEQGGVPGVIFQLGVGAESGLHTARFDFGSEALEPGILMMANLALRALERQ